MPDSKQPDLAESFPPPAFDIHDLQDEIRADRLCHQLLLRFAGCLRDEEGFAPADAGALAHGADYFLREYVIGERRENIFRIAPGRLRQFAGTWYILRNLEPNLRELEGILAGVITFYRYLAGHGLVTEGQAHALAREGADLAFFQQRIDSFWALGEGDYPAWERACPLRD